MVQAYNFLASWQLFPEKCMFESGTVPKSGNYKIDAINNGHELIIATSWITLDGEAIYSQYIVKPDGTPYPTNSADPEETVEASILNASTIRVCFSKKDHKVLEVINEIMPNGYLRLTQTGTGEDGKSFTNISLYHKQLMVLPYASAVGGVAVRPTKEGVIKHKALSAMEEQTEIQLDQIREQISLLARQAQDIRKRRELSMMVYEAKLSFKPQIGQTYHLYEKRDGSHILSLVAPSEWGGSGPYKDFVASVKLLADHTWKEISYSGKQKFEDISFDEQ